MRGLALINHYDIDVTAQMNYMKLKPSELVFVILSQPCLPPSIVCLLGDAVPDSLVTNRADWSPNE
jgi:hypothetical protein